MKNFFYGSIAGLSLPGLALAFGSPPHPPINPSNIPSGAVPTKIADWFLILRQVVSWIFTVAIVLGVAMLIIGGIMYITSAGGDRAKTAGKLIIYAIVGIAVAALAWAIVNLVGNFFVGTKIIT